MLSWSRCCILVALYLYFSSSDILFDFLLFFKPTDYNLMLIKIIWEQKA